jgi:hypothetical protein
VADRDRQPLTDTCGLDNLNWNKSKRNAHPPASGRVLQTVQRESPCLPCLEPPATGPVSLILGLVLSLPSQRLSSNADQEPSATGPAQWFSDADTFVSNRNLDHGGPRCLPDQPLLFSGFRCIGRLDVAPTNVAFKASARMCWSFPAIATKSPSTRNGGRSSTVWAMTVRSRSTNTIRLTLRTV